MFDELDAQGDSLSPRVSWAQLIDDHDRIGWLCAELCRLFTRPTPDPQEASVLLLRLSLLVTDHLCIEDQVVDMTRMALSAGHSRAETVAMSELLSDLKRDWVAYLGYWSPAAIAAGWDAFSAESRAMTNRLSAQLARENAILYAGALRHGAIDLGAPILH